MSAASAVATPTPPPPTAGPAAQQATAAPQPPKAAPKPRPPKAPPPKHLLAARKGFDGTWRKLGQGDCFVIKGDEVRWPTGFVYKFTTLCLGECALEMNGEVYAGKFRLDQNGGSNRLEWDNGSVWVRDDQPPAPAVSSTAPTGGPAWSSAGPSWLTTPQAGQPRPGTPPVSASAPLTAPGLSTVGRPPAASVQPGLRPVGTPMGAAPMPQAGLRPVLGAAPGIQAGLRPVGIPIGASFQTVQQAIATPTVSAASQELWVKPLTGTWKKVGSSSKYRIEGQKLHWLDSGAEYSLRAFCPAQYIFTIGATNFCCTLKNDKLVFNNGSEWVRDTGTAAAPTAPAPAKVSATEAKPQQGAAPKAEPPSKPTVVHGPGGEKLGSKIDALLAQIEEGSKAEEAAQEPAPAAAAGAQAPSAEPAAPTSSAAATPAAATSVGGQVASSASAAAAFMVQQKAQIAVSAQMAAVQQQAAAIEATRLQAALAAQNKANNPSSGSTSKPIAVLAQSTPAAKAPAKSGPSLPTGSCNSSSSTAPAPSEAKTASKAKSVDERVADLLKSASGDTDSSKKDGSKKKDVVSSKSADAMKKLNESLRLRKGDVVVVQTNFLGDSGGKELRQNLEGVVREADAAGDAKIEFGINGTCTSTFLQWVLKRNLHHLRADPDKTHKWMDTEKIEKAKKEKEEKERRDKLLKEAKTREAEAKKKEVQKAEDAKKVIEALKKKSSRSRSRSRGKKKTQRKSDRSRTRSRDRRHGRGNKSRSKDRRSKDRSRRRSPSRSPKKSRAKSPSKKRARSTSRDKRRKRKSSSSPEKPKTTTKAPFVPRQMREQLSAPGKDKNSSGDAKVEATTSKSKGIPPTAPVAKVAATVTSEKSAKAAQPTSDIGRSEVSVKATAKLMERLARNGIGTSATDTSSPSKKVDAAKKPESSAKKAAAEATSPDASKGIWTGDFGDEEEDESWSEKPAVSLADITSEQAWERFNLLKDLPGEPDVCEDGELSDTEVEDDMEEAEEEDAEMKAGPPPEVADLRARALALATSLSGDAPMGDAEEPMEKVSPPVEPQRRVRVFSTNGQAVNLMAACGACAKFGEVVAMHLEGTGTDATAVIEFRDASSAQAAVEQCDAESLKVLLCTNQG